MVVCRFFLQGTCRFGSNCKFDHTVNTGQPTEGTSIMRQRHPSSTGGAVDVATLVRSVQTDMINCEKGGQWLLSSYAPFREKPTFPGFEDKSFEETRAGFYEASAAGTVDQFNRQLRAAQQDMVLKIRALQNPNDEVVKTLQNIYNTHVNQATPSTIFGQSNTFGEPPRTSSSSFTQTIFGRTAAASVPPTNNIFGGQTQQPIQSTTYPAAGGGSIFGGGGGAAVAPSAQGIFAQAAKSASSIFSQPPPLILQQPQTVQAPIFGTPNVPSPMYQQQPPAPSASGIFAQAAQKAVGSIFGGGGGVPATTGSIFASNQPAAAQPTNIFQQQQSAPPPTNIFHQQPPQQMTNSPFGTAPSLSNSIFSQGNVQPQTGHSPFATNIFQQHSVAKPTTDGNNSKFYSNIEQLSENEMHAFKEAFFEIGKIPISPPPLQLCF